MNEAEWPEVITALRQDLAESVRQNGATATVGVLSRYAWEVDVAEVLKQIPWKDAKKRHVLARTARAELDQVHKSS